VATASWDRTVKLWDAATGKALATLEGHALPVLGVAFSPDGKWLASGGGKWAHPEIPDQPGEVKLWDVAGRKELAALRGHADRVLSVAFAPGGKTLASAGWGKTVRLWEVAGRKELAALRLPEARAFVPRPTLAAAYSPAAGLLALAPEDGTVVLLDVAGEVRHVLKGHTDAVVALAFAPDGRTLASGSTDNTARLWDPRTGKELRKLEGHRSWVYGVAFAADGKALASGGYDKTVRLWDVATGKQRRLFEGHKGSVRAVAFSPDGEALASAGSDRTVRLWDLAGKKGPVLLKGHGGTVRAVAFAPDGQTVASTGEDGTVRLWDPGAGTARSTIEPRAKAPGDSLPELTALAFAPRGRLLLAGGEDGVVRVWDGPTGASRGALRGRGAVAGLAFAADGRLILARADGTAQAWSAVLARTRRPRASLSGNGEYGWAVAFSPDGRTLAVLTEGDAGGTLRLWEPAAGKERAVVKEEKRLRCAAFSPDGKLLATGGADNTAALRDPATGRARLVLKGHTERLNALAFRPDGKVLLTGSIDRTAKL
jgi:WD40 repeat protein